MLGLLILCPLWGLLSGLLFVQTLLSVANMTVSILGFLRRENDRKDNALAMAAYLGSALAFGALLVLGTWLLRDVAHALASSSQRVVYWVAAIASALYALWELPTKLRKTMEFAFQPGALSKHLAQEKLNQLLASGRFDLQDVLHVGLIDGIRDKYASLLSDESGPYGRCLFKPASLLPYPRAAIAGALHALLDFAEGRIDSPYLDPSLRSAERAGTIRACLMQLDDFLDVAPSRLPNDPQENVRVGSTFSKSSSLRRGAGEGRTESPG